MPVYYGPSAKTFPCMLEQVYTQGLQRLGMQPEDVDFVVCAPDEVGFPRYMDKDDMAWGFRLVYQFKDRRRAFAPFVTYSPDCPIGKWEDHSDQFLNRR